MLLQDFMVDLQRSFSCLNSREINILKPEKLLLRCSFMENAFLRLCISLYLLLSNLPRSYSR